MNVTELENLLKEAKYDPAETEFLVDGFTNGFELGYEGNREVQLQSPNLKLNIGTKIELWNKVMKEVKEKRYAGPFKENPFKDQGYIQSPIGLVPKDGGTKTRLIFHLSYPRNTNLSVNANTPKSKTKVKYPDFTKAIELCLKAGKHCYLSKSDMTSAFRHLCIKPSDWPLLVMKAKSPFDDQWYYFVDKCLPFGASISCAHFQRFSNAVAYLVKFRTKMDNVNYLDDFLFVALLERLCNGQLEVFKEICETINFPISIDKTFPATNNLSFLGLLIDAVNQLILIPVEKILKARQLLEKMILKSKATIAEVQKLCGFLNFISKCILPGRTFTRRLYALLKGNNTKLKKHHHVDIKAEAKMDLRMWSTFLNHPSIFARSFIDTRGIATAIEVPIYTDASRNKKLGCGGHHGNEWFAYGWNEEFMQINEPSIAYLELYGLAIGVLLWAKNYKDKRIVIFCDNTSVVEMINKNTSNCKNCMVLIRIIVLHSLLNNVRIYARHVRTHLNKIADLLSRKKFEEFWKLTAGRMNETSEQIPRELNSMQNLWLPANE